MESDHGDQELPHPIYNDPNWRQKFVNEEYKQWKKNAPYFYDCLLSTAFEWPTLTAQWFPDKQDVPDKPYATHRLLLGTQTSDNKQNYVQIAQVQLPKGRFPFAEDYDEERGEIGGYGGNKKTPMEVKINVIQKIDHPSDVNKARYQPQNPNMIATLSGDGRAFVFDKTKHPSAPTGTIRPELELDGHTKEGFGLSWNPLLAGHLATSSEDFTVRLWDLTQYTKGDRLIRPARTYTHHSAIVNDVQHHPVHRSLLGSVSDDLSLQIIDTRQGETNRAAACAKDQHEDAVNAIAFNPAVETLVATGSSDKSVGLFDIRNMKSRLHSAQHHKDNVTEVAWHPHEESVLASSGNDGRVMFWDFSHIGEEQSEEDAQDGPPELLFVHGGHTETVNDFSWNLNDPWLLCSAAQNNVVQAYKISDEIVGKELQDIPIGELEP